LPLDVIGILMSVDWFIDRCRTTINVLGDCIAVAVVGSSLGIMDPQKSTSEKVKTHEEFVGLEYSDVSN